MNWNRVLTLYGVHCEGEVGRIITGGIVSIPGETMLDKLNYINNTDDWVRKFTLQEPRGSAQMSVNILLPPVSQGADAGFIVLQPDKAHALSGSNTMCVSTYLLETGVVRMEEPQTKLTLDTAVGQIQVLANCSHGKVTSTEVEMCPSFADGINKRIFVDQIGELKVDIGFGGCYFALCDVNQLGLKITTEFARELVEKGDLIKEAIDKQITVRHPEIPEFNHVEYVMFTDVCREEQNVFINGTIIYPGRVDRSPCGTGTSARMAIMHAKGLINEGDVVHMQSIIGGRFRAEITKVITMKDGRICIIPRLIGRCWIYAIEHLGFDPTDPFPLGYTLSDTWGPKAK
ncbi:MAG: proline racemase family protein [Bacillota bacterium]